MNVFISHFQSVVANARVATLGAGLIAAAMLAGLAATPAYAISVWDRISDSGEMRCAGLEHVPISWKAGASEFQGYVPEICRALVKDLSIAMGKDITLTFVPTAWATIILDIQSGRIDIGAALAPTEDRKKAVDMPGPAYTMAEGIIYRKGFEPLANWSDYNNADIKEASIAGTSGEKIARERLPESQHLSFPDRASVMLAIQSGRADISADAFISALAAIKEAGPILGGFTVPEPRIDSPSNFAIQRDDDSRFADWVQKWSDVSRASGQTRQLISQAIKDAGIPIDDLSGIGN